MIPKNDSNTSPFFQYDALDTKKYESYFLFEKANTRYVRRSASILNYGKHFKYSETWTHSHLYKALLANLMICWMALFLFLPPLRFLVSFILPPGSGPSETIRKKGYFQIEVYGISSDLSKKYKVTLSTHEDPGYGATSKMIAEAALTLAKDKEKISKTGALKPSPGGVVTCASGLGQALVDRLKASNVLEIELVPVPI